MTRTTPLDIVYRDEQLVAINKPVGLLVHRSPIDRHETRFAVQMLRDQIGQFVYPLHRLDKPTSGLLLFALDQESARRLSGQFSDGSLSKRYLAIVRGHCIARADIEHPLRDETDHRGRRCDDGALREASTTLVLQRQWRLPMPVDRYPEARYSLVELSPHTGRHRQLRRHMKHIAHPIIGDVRYGKGSHNRFSVIISNRNGCCWPQFQSISGTPSADRWCGLTARPRTISSVLLMHSMPCSRSQGTQRSSIVPRDPDSSGPEVSFSATTHPICHRFFSRGGYRG